MAEIELVGLEISKEEGDAEICRNSITEAKKTLIRMAENKIEMLFKSGQGIYTLIEGFMNAGGDTYDSERRCLDSKYYLTVSLIRS